MNDDSHFLMSLSCEMASNGREYYSQRCREIADEIERLRGPPLRAREEIDPATLSDGELILCLEEMRKRDAAVLALSSTAGQEWREPEGHGEPCYYCGKPCSSLAGNPSEWPIPLCHRDEPGVVKWHHTGCVTDRLIENQSPAPPVAEPIVADKGTT